MTQPLIGRATERERIEALVSEGARWITLWGPPGIGKTALAQACLPDGWVVLDDVEQVDAAAWLDERPGARVLATGQRRTGLPREVVVPIGPLSVADSVALLHARLGDALDLERVALALDGVPLALELAAGRWPLLGTDGLLERLEAGQDVLATRTATDPRHASLNRALQAAWDRLDPREQDALTALAPLRSPFDLATAEVLVGPEALELLEELCDASLLLVPQPGRFVLCGGLRRFLGPPPLARAAHASWVASRLPASEPDLADAAWWLLHHGDPEGAERIGTALASVAPGQHVPLLEQIAAATGSALAFRTLGATLRHLGQFPEAQAALQQALQADTDAATRGSVLRELGVLHHHRRDVDAARRCYEEALACHREVGDRRGEGLCIGNLGALDHDVCRYEDAEARYSEALEVLHEVGDSRVEAIFLANQAVLRQEQGQLHEAERAYRRALALHEAEADARMVAITSGNLGLLLHELGRVEEAEALHEQALQALDGLADPTSEGLCLARLAAVRAPRDPAEATALLDRADAVLASGGDELSRRVVALFRAFPAAAAGRLDEVRHRLEDHDLVDVSQDARVAARLLRATAGLEREALVVTDDGFQLPGAEPQDLTRFASSRRMLLALRELRLAAPGATLPLEGLFQAGWPGEAIAWESMRNRVHVNLARLRRMGLKDALQRTEDGYRLDPDLPVVA